MLHCSGASRFAGRPAEAAAERVSAAAERCRTMMSQPMKRSAYLV